jgi:hypothetical protein
MFRRDHQKSEWATIVRRPRVRMQVWREDIILVCEAEWATIVRRLQERKHFWRQETEDAVILVCEDCPLTGPEFCSDVTCYYR